MGIFGREEAVVYKPVDKVALSSNSDEIYLRANVKAPRMAGFLVKLFAWLLELRIIGKIVLNILKKENLIHKLISFAELEEPPVFVPVHPSEEYGEQVKCIEFNLSPFEQVQEALECLPSSLENIPNAAKSSFHRWTILDYSRAYRSGVLTPNMVAERFIAAADKYSNHPCNMSFFINYDAKDILRQATESTDRHKRGEPISILDGVPIAIKDEIDCTPYPTTGGTKWLHKVRSCTDDACCVERLRSCGALLVGKTNMHELGSGTSGINPHYGATRNPYDTSRVSGGSSSGSAAVVCAGLCPVSLGVDGGGSVRMPAALCGVVGFKPTFGRIPHSGVLPLNWTVGMVGILAGCVEDALITYAAISGQLPSDKSTVSMPKVTLPLLKPNSFLDSIKLAQYGEWFNDCSDDVKFCCSEALQKLRKHYGWETVEVTIPEIEVMRLAHYLTIGSECYASLDCLLQKLNYEELGWDTRVACSVYGAFSAKEYIKAQRIRSRQMEFHRRIFLMADVIVTPTTGVTAYTIKDDALRTGELDYVNGAALVRYQIAGNFLGLPAVTVPVGYDKAGLPIGLQFIGKPWSEATLLHIAFAMQALCVSDYRKPQVFSDMLN
ncbi:hypothetical protein Nepgr_014942 [Nepenthes gracilis]|uniref:Amidase domain-containing protein n=1 Tax=Nepenthes gracilis TaxID=150966 RepID=A0AAD3SM56_NEPGR|nr:hypothetical protein Nepgr_014942 [Nepenthes gracilis]